MSNDLNNNINEADFEYLIIVKKADDILSELTDDLTERLIYESIIDSIERSASETIRDGKIASLPSIGCIRKNPIRKVIQDNHETFRIIRKSLTTEQYKQHVKEVIIDAKIEHERNDKQRVILKQIKSRNRKKYDILYLKLGKAYAEMFIQSIYMLKEVPFNLELQQRYDELNGL